jgi:hypothetical protein|tara:strand:- start:630 stop:2231 length:1602 start_codon:yes stop_codon:yes gene_type:complete
MPIVQISRIQHRRGSRTDLPQLAAGELGWVIDEQRLFIGNGTVSDGAPAVGNTEIVTSGSSAFTTALSHTYKGYLGDATPVTTSQQRTIGDRLDEYVSVRDFGAKGDDSTADLSAIQNAVDELYRDTDKDDTRARRVLFFPAGTYKINGALTIPPYAHLVGEGPDKTIIKNSGNNAVIVTEDDEGNIGANIGNSSATTPTQIQVSNMTLRTTVAYGGVSLDRVTNAFFNNVKFQGSYASGGADSSNSKGVTVNHSTATYSTTNVTFNQCQFTKFARLVDISYNATNIRFHACDFATAYYGALIGAEMDGSTAGLTDGPRDIQFTNSSWSDIGQQAILVAPKTGTTDSAGPRHIVSHGNFYAKTVANNFEGTGTFSEVPIIQFDNDECSSVLDFFERTDLRRSDGSSNLNAAPEVQGIGISTKAIKQETLINNTSSATTINEFPALAGKGIRIKYKIVRGTLDRTGEFVISASTTAVASDDTFTESGATVGVTLSAVLDNKDSTAGNETVALKYVMTDSSSTNATFDYQTTIIA